jgi:hypothetical protein
MVERAVLEDMSLEALHILRSSQRRRRRKRRRRANSPCSHVQEPPVQGHLQVQWDGKVVVTVNPPCSCGSEERSVLEERCVGTQRERCKIGQNMSMVA